MILITGNDLPTGDVIWWTGQDWSRHIADAVDAGSEAEAQAIIIRENAARHVFAAYTAEADATDTGPMPRHIKERVRASGPTVRADLGINPTIPIVRA
jgi:hypothetical protein